MVRWREGYDIRDVDTFLARVDAGLVTSADIDAALFAPTRLGRGYAMGEVDDYLAGIQQGLPSSAQTIAPLATEQAQDARRPRWASWTLAIACTLAAVFVLFELLSRLLARSLAPIPSVVTLDYLVALPAIAMWAATGGATSFRADIRGGQRGGRRVGFAVMVGVLALLFPIFGETAYEDAHSLRLHGVLVSARVTEVTHGKGSHTSASFGAPDGATLTCDVDGAGDHHTVGETIDIIDDSTAPEDNCAVPRVAKSYDKAWVFVGIGWLLAAVMIGLMSIQASRRRSAGGGL